MDWIVVDAEDTGFSDTDTPISREPGFDCHLVLTLNA